MGEMDEGYERCEIAVFDGNIGKGRVCTLWYVLCSKLRHGRLTQSSKHKEYYEKRNVYVYRWNDALAKITGPAISWLQSLTLSGIAGIKYFGALFYAEKMQQLTFEYIDGVTCVGSKDIEHCADGELSLNLPNLDTFYARGLPDLNEIDFKENCERLSHINIDMRPEKHDVFAKPKICTPSKVNISKLKALKKLELTPFGIVKFVVESVSKNNECLQEIVINECMCPDEYNENAEQLGRILPGVSYTVCASCKKKLGNGSCGDM